MATAKTLPPIDAKLYDEDFYLWTQAQAEALRRLAAERWNGPLDLEHLAEEVEDLGKAEQRLVRSQLIRILHHCLKLQFSPATAPRAGWQNSIDEARFSVNQALTRSLRRLIEPELPQHFAMARRRAARDLARYEECASLPEACPYSLDQLLEDEWYPEPSGPSAGRRGT